MKTRTRAKMATISLIGSVALALGGVGTTSATAEPVSFAAREIPTEPPMSNETTSPEGTPVSSGETITVPVTEDTAVAIVTTETDVAGKTTTRAANETTAPTCVRAVVEKLAIQVYNDCADDVRVKVIVTSPVGAIDSECRSVEKVLARIFVGLLRASASTGW